MQSNYVISQRTGRAPWQVAGGAPADQRTSLQRSLVSFHFNLLMLQNYVALNFTGVVKILKKFDKKVARRPLPAPRCPRCLVHVSAREHVVRKVAQVGTSTCANFFCSYL